MGTISSTLLNSWYGTGSSSSASSSTIQVGASNAGEAAVLLGGGTVTMAPASSSTASSGPSAPSPPWLTATATPTSTNPSSIPSQTSALMQSLLAGNKLINPSTVKLAGTGETSTATTNYRNLFALYQGLTSLQSIATAAQAKSLSSSQTQQLESAFAAGMKQVQTYLDGQPFEGFDVYQTKPVVSVTTSTAIAASHETYTTGTLYTGPPNGEVPGFQGDGQFQLTATRASGAQVTVTFNLADVQGPRNFGNVLTYMNGQMQAAGLATRFGEAYTAGATTTKNGTTTTAPGSYALKVIGSTAESLTFNSLGATDPAVYVGQSSGITSAVAATGTTPNATQQLLKFDASSDPVDSTATDSQVFSKAMGANVSKVMATATSSDGSVYTLADVTGTTNGQSIQGSQDVALIKYDSAGNVVFTQTLGADTSASGYGLAVSADGSQVAVVGSTPDNLGATAATTSTTSTTTPAPQGFLSVFDSSGNEQWTQQTQALGGSGGGVQPNSVAFGSNGMVYVAGQVDGHVPGSGAASGGVDAYIQAFHATSVPLKDGSGTSQWVVSPSAAVQYGTSGQDHATGIAVGQNGVYVSSVENGSAVVRQFTPSGSSGEGLTQTAMTNLGSLQGGDVAGVAINTDGSVILAGSTHNGALNAGTVTQAYSSGEEGFIASLSPDLQPQTLSYLGGDGDQTISAVTTSNGQVYVAGQVAATPLPGAGETTAWDGYVAAVDPTTGEVSWTQQYQGAQHEAAPSSIAVADGGTSVLDQLGLPDSIDTTPSQEITTNTSLRAGDQFYLQSGSGAPVAVTIGASDTFQTLIQKIQAASHYTVKATLVAGTNGNTLKLAPAFQNTLVNILPGPTGRNALSALGIAQGTLNSAAIQETSVAPSSNAGPPTQHDTVKNGYSLNLASTLNLSSPARATAAGAALSLAITAVKGIYRDMTTSPTVGKGSVNGAVPAYLTNEIAQYQAALQRLTGSG